MPKRKTKQRVAAVSPREIEALRRAIQAGFPWALRVKGDDTFRTTGLSIRLNILLSYVTGIAAGACVFLPGENIRAEKPWQP